MCVCVIFSLMEVRISHTLIMYILAFLPHFITYICRLLSFSLAFCLQSFFFLFQFFSYCFPSCNIFPTFYMFIFVFICCVSISLCMFELYFLSLLLWPSNLPVSLTFPAFTFVYKLSFYSFSVLVFSLSLCSFLVFYSLCIHLLSLFFFFSPFHRVSFLCIQNCSAYFPY